MRGKVCLVTGGTSGIGRVAVIELARMGAQVVFTGRDEARGAQVLNAIQELGGQSVPPEFLPADLSGQAAVRNLAGQFLARHARLHVLINNAGTVYAQRQLTGDGIERTFATNHLAPFLLTNLLHVPLAAAASDGFARVVNVSSSAHRVGRLDLGDLNAARRYKPFEAYGNSKLANILFTTELARRWQPDGVTANCLHPGVVRTNIWSHSRGILRWLTALAQPFMISAERGARTIVYLASSAEVAAVSGKYFVRCQEAATSPAAHDSALAARLWEASEGLTGLA